MPKNKTLKEKKEEEYKRLLLIILGAVFILNGINGIIRTFCLTRASLIGVNVIHIHDINICLHATAPITYLFSGASIFFGILLILLEKFVDWRYGKANKN